MLLITGVRRLCIVRHPCILTKMRVFSAIGLPKTRSGKIMRRILRKIATDIEDIGDTSTLADSSVIEALRESKKDAC